MTFIPIPRDRTRVLLAGAACLLPFVLIVVTVANWRGLLPQNIWAQPTALLFLLAATVSLAPGVVLLLRAIYDRERGASRLVYMIAGAASGVAAALWTIGAGLTLSADRGITPAIGVWAFPVILAAAWGLVPGFLVPSAIDAAITHTDRDGAHADNDAPAWSRSMFGPALIVIGSALLIIGVAAVALTFASGSPRGVALIAAFVLVIAALLVAAVGWVEVVADATGLRVTSRVAPFMTKLVPLNQIMKAEKQQFRALSWGGWGYRILPGRSALILRGGEGVTVHLENGKEFSVTVDDASRFVVVVNRLVVRSHR